MTADLDAAILDVVDHIDEESPAPPPPAYIDVVPASRMFVDRAYQRPLDDLRVALLVDKFDPTMLGVIEVSARDDGRFAIVDGQHRWALVKEVRGADAPVVCNVHRGLTVADEARLFYEIDRGRRVLTGWDRWWAKRGSGDPTVLAIEKAVVAHDLTISDRGQDGCVRATKALTDIFELGGVELLDETLQIVLAAFGPAMDALDGAILYGTALLLAHYGHSELSAERLIAQMQTIAPRQLKARANLLREAQKGTMPRLVAAVLVERYNAARGSKLEPFADRVRPQTKGSNVTGAAERKQAAIRLWARRNGLGVNAKGHISREVVAAYHAAHPEHAS